MNEGRVKGDELCSRAKQTPSYTRLLTYSNILLLFNIMEHINPRELHTANGQQGVNALVGQRANDADRLTAATKVSPVDNTIGLQFPSRGDLFV